jgi:hypothetical protein
MASNFKYIAEDALLQFRAKMEFDQTILIILLVIPVGLAILFSVASFLPVRMHEIPAPRIHPVYNYNLMKNAIFKLFRWFNQAPTCNVVR